MYIYVERKTERAHFAFFPKQILPNLLLMRAVC